MYNIKMKKEKQTNFEISWGKFPEKFQPLVIIMMETINNALYEKNYRITDGHYAHFTLIFNLPFPRIYEDSNNSKVVSLEHLVEIEELVNAKIIGYIENLPPTLVPRSA
jgi:hypothetical protein